MAFLARNVLVTALLALFPAIGIADPADLVLKDDFESSDFAAGGGLFYKRNKEQERGFVRFQNEVVRFGQQAIELSVDPSCSGSGTECSERAEVWEKPDIVVNYYKPIWYAFSMQLGKPVPRENHRLVMAQWKREIRAGAAGDYSPFLALRLSSGRLVATVVSDKAAWEPKDPRHGSTGCPAGHSPAARPDPHNQVRATVAAETAMDEFFQELPGCSPSIRLVTRAKLPLAESGWIDFVFMVKPDPKGSGAIEIAANGVWVATVEGAIGHDGPGLYDTQYFKFGPYRAGRPDRWTIYFDGFGRSSRCQDLASAELCATILKGTGRG